MNLTVTLDQVYSGHSDSIYTLEPGFLAHQVYSGSGDGFVGAWNILTGIFEKPLAKMPASIYSLKKHPSKPLLFIGLQNGELFILDLKERRVLKSLALSDQGLFDMAYSGLKNTLYVADGTGRLTFIDTENLEAERSIQLTNKAIRCVNVSPCERFLITGASDHHFYFLDVAGDPVVRQSAEAHGSSVFTAIYKEGHELLTGGRDALLKHWKWASDSQTWQLEQTLPAHNFTINKIAMRPDRQLFATASRDKTIKLWRSSDLQLLKVIDLAKYPDGHNHSVNTLVWVGHERLFSAGDDKRMLGWKIQ